MMSLAQAHALLPGSLLLGDGQLRLARVHTDSRSLQPGDLFVALRGERFDAHDFLPQARAAGAVAALAEQGLQAAGLPGLQVADSRAALGALAARWRAQLHGPLIAVTGSNGKTTVTQMVAAILRVHAGAASLATQGNFNNDIGVPLTLLRLRPEHRIAVLELGMNHPGEIAQLAKIAQPTVALVNNAQREHLEFMATVEAVARENGSVIGALPPDGTAVFPADEAYTALWRDMAGARRVLTFALQGPADLTAQARAQLGRWQVSARTPLGPLDFTLQVAGLHNVKNALAAAACALAAGVPLDAIAQGLSAFEPVAGRSRSLSLHRPDGAPLSLVDDSYNANPDSTRAAIAWLAGLPGRRVLVLGDMGELGADGPALHAEVGACARDAGVDALHALGELSRHSVAAFGARALHHEDPAALVAALREACRPDTTILVKGSRFMRMERVVDALTGGTSAGSDH